jgi:hypothetical protein
VFDSGTYFWIAPHNGQSFDSNPHDCAPQTGNAVIHTYPPATSPHAANLPVGNYVALAVDTSTKTLFALNCVGSVAAIPESTILTGSGPTGGNTLTSRPYGMAVDSVNHHLYVALGSGGIDVVDESGDATNGQIIQQIAYPAETVAVDSSTHNVYAFGTNSTSFATIDESGDSNTGTVVAQQSIPGGDAYTAYSAVVDSSNHYLYVDALDVTANAVTGFAVDEANDLRHGDTVMGAIGGSDLAVDPSTHIVISLLPLPSLAYVVAPLP